MTDTAQLDHLAEQFRRLSVVRPVGRITEISTGTLQVDGLMSNARIGDQIRVCSQGQRSETGEIIRLLEKNQAVVLPDGSTEGMALGDRVVLLDQPHVSPHESWIGRIIDANGRPLDGKPLLQGRQPKALRQVPPPATTRQSLGKRLDTGMAIFDTMLPIAEGQRLGVFAGSGVGKSSMLGHFARRLEADIVVCALIGERGREIRHFVDDVLGPEGRARTIVVAATSDQSPLLRRRSAWTAMTIAEHFREKGLSVLFLADSITRFAEAHREIVTAAGEPPVVRGHPPSTVSLITALCERAGPGIAGEGAITGIFSVLVAGSDMEEPVADILRGVLDGHTVLDRKIAERGRFPAIDVLRSVSRSLPMVLEDGEHDIISDVRALLNTYEKNEMMLTAGLYQAGTDRNIDLANEVFPELEAFFARADQPNVAASFDQIRLILRRQGNQIP